MSTKEFATVVKETCNHYHVGPFEKKAWIHKIWLAGFSRTLDYADFKTLLWDANRAGSLELCQVDMVQCVDATCLRRSLMEVNGARFHLIKF